MKIGAYVSGAGHAGLFVWLLIGGFFVARDDFDAIRVTDVSIISADEFQAMQPSGPETGDAPPALEAAAQDAPAAAPAPAPRPDPAPAPAPAPTPAPAPAPAAEAAPEPVETPQPPDPVIAEESAAPDGDPGAAIVVEDAPELAPEQAETIADEVVAAPEPEIEIADTAQDQVAPDETAEPVTEPQETQEQTAQEETTTQVVTEADETSNQAPTRSTRPGRKPAPPPVVAEAEPEADPVPGLAESIAGAVTEANSENAIADNANPGGGSGQPITRAEKGAFILGIQKCWNVGALSTDALKVTVIVGFTMTPDAKPEIGSIRLVGAEGGSGAAVDRAYEAARRAIIRCGSAGFGLPADKYDQWRGVEVKFNATTKEIR